VDGSLIELSPYGYTDNVTYYRLAYWSDGLRITGYYAEPKDTSKQYPAVIYNRGGHSQGGLISGIQLAPFAESGMIAVATQYRGAAGSEGRDEFGGADVHDVLNLITFLKSRPNVDPNRIAMFGASRGAMMTYIALRTLNERKTNDIKVAATVSGLSDLFMWAQQRPDLNSGFYLETIGASTSSNRQAFIDRSATYWPSKIKVPLLIEHGDADSEVSVAQSNKLYRLLRGSGRITKLIVYKGDTHGLPGNLDGVPEALAWFQKYIGRPGDNFDFYVHANAITHAYEVLRPR
jgi:dipeptidyl aminopeptidase/acylaminoacyl peptidase